MAPQQRYIVTEARILAENWTRRQMPAFSVMEVAKIFGMSTSWVRLKLTTEEGKRPKTSFVREDGTPMEFRRRNPERTDTPSARVFLLSDIQPMAESLHGFGDIDSGRLVKILRVVEALADVYGLLEAPAAKEGD